MLKKIILLFFCIFIGNAESNSDFVVDPFIINYIFVEDCGDGNVILEDPDTKIKSNDSGILQMCSQKIWHDVCDYSWTQCQSLIVCRHLTGKNDISKIIIPYDSIIVYI